MSKQLFESSSLEVVVDQTVGALDYNCVLNPSKLVGNCHRNVELFLATLVVSSLGLLLLSIAFLNKFKKKQNIDQIIVLLTDYNSRFFTVSSVNLV